MAACSGDNLALGRGGRSGMNWKVAGLGMVLMVFSLYRRMSVRLVLLL